ncbi:hypothetical protein [Thioflavicoccus mobilis]|uniref:hypothetical protein n=1 Tax=Thioflavicoccus mobilis TaxID=80679 RepID=UPI0012F8AA9D|nr:hypothetical protein [Thioflavicoccus mobilis]
MKLELKSIQDRGVSGKERIIMRALTNLDVGQFAVFETGFNKGGVNTSTHDCFWFPDKEISEGDWVVLYTKQGIDKEKIQKSGATAHFFYWGKENAKWGSSARAPVVLQIDSWDFIPPEDNA